MERDIVALLIKGKYKEERTLTDFGEIKQVSLRDIWPNEATNFTPWLASNIQALGKALGMDIELTEREASVGDFSLDLLARDLGTSQIVIIENQLTQTDHDHLGKLLTYAAGFSASVVVWVAETIRDEHRMALEWLNQRTDVETQFFGVVIEVFKIDTSKPAFNFKPIVYPNDWQKSKKTSATSNTSERGEKYRAYFQSLIDELREIHKFTGAKAGQPQNWYSFSSGIQGILYSAVFAQGGKARTEMYIDRLDQEVNKMFFDKLREDESIITEEFGAKLEWERLDDKRASRIAIYRDGAIDLSDSELENIRKWHIENLLKFKQVFPSKIKKVENLVSQ